MPCNPAHRRHRQGPPGAGAGRPGRRNGPGGRRLLHPVPDAEPGQGPGGPLPAGPGGPAEVPGAHEACAGAAGAAGSQAGHGDGSPDGKTAPSAPWSPGWGWNTGSGPRWWPRGPTWKAGSSPARVSYASGPERDPPPPWGAVGVPAGPGPAAAPVQDRHASAAQRPQRGFLPDGAAGGRSPSPALFLLHRPGAGKPGGLLPDLYQREDPSGHPGQSGPFAAVFRRDHRRGAPLLPVHRGQGGALCGQAPASAVCGALRPGHRRAVPAGLFLQPCRWTCSWRCCIRWRGWNTPR